MKITIQIDSIDDLQSLMALLKTEMSNTEISDSPSIGPEDSVKHSLEILPDGRMGVANAALYLGFSDKTLAMMRSDGTGPRFIKAGKIFYYKDDLDDWIAEHKRVVSTAQDRTLNAEVKSRIPPRRRGTKKSNNGAAETPEAG